MTELRRLRIRTADSASAIVKAGRNRYQMWSVNVVPKPATGNQWSPSDSTRISRMPSQKFGVVRTNRKTTRTSWSIQLPLLTAASSPNVKVRKAASTIAYTARPIEIGKRLATMSRTG